MREGKKDYRQVSLDEFSDDDDNNSDEEYGGGSHNHHHHHQNRRHNRSSSSSSNHGDRIGDGSSNYNKNSIVDPRQQQLDLMKRQDEGLDILGQQAERLGNLSIAISDELTFQNQMLDDMDHDLGDAHDHLDIVTRTTKDFIAKSGGWQNFSIILCLIVVIVVLILLILYT
jgi:hypothetical protein